MEMAAMPASFWGGVGYTWEHFSPLLLRGAGITLLVALTGTIIGFLIGLVIGVVRTIPLEPGDGFLKKGLLKIVNFFLLAYIEVFRGTPMMVQAMVIYFGVAQFYNIHLEPISAGIFIVSINTGAYMAEIVRGGIISIDNGQFEAAHSIGMSHTQTMASIILPQAIRNILPPLSNEFVINIKDTSVLNVIAVTEIFFQAKTIAGATFRFFEPFFVASIIYFIMTFTTTRILRMMEKRLEGPDVYMIHGSQSVPEAVIKVVDRGEKR